MIVASRRRSVSAEWVVNFPAMLAHASSKAWPITFIASGPNVDDYAWTHSFFQKLIEKGPGPLRNVYGTALHYYCGTTGTGD